MIVSFVAVVLKSFSTLKSPGSFLKLLMRGPSCKVAGAEALGKISAGDFDSHQPFSPRVENRRYLIKGSGGGGVVPEFLSALGSVDVTWKNPSRDSGLQDQQGAREPRG